MPEVDTSKEAKSSLGKEIGEDTMVLADLYCQLEFLLGDLKKVPPTPAEIEAMAVTLFIDRQKNKRRGESQSRSEDSGGAPRRRAPESEADEPDPIECPDCGRDVNPTYSAKKSVWYYRCPDCDIFINKNGTTTKAGGKKGRR